nr:hypothetical protein Iba_chr06cCG10980 [Ipomoea batatas]
MGPVEEELDFLGGQVDEANQKMSQVEEKLDVVHESMLTLKNIMIDDAKKGEGSVSSEDGMLNGSNTTSCSRTKLLKNKRQRDEQAKRERKHCIIEIEQAEKEVIEKLASFKRGSLLDSDEHLGYQVRISKEIKDEMQAREIEGEGNIYVNIMKGNHKEEKEMQNKQENKEELNLKVGSGSAAHDHGGNSSVLLIPSRFEGNGSGGILGSVGSNVYGDLVRATRDQRAMEWFKKIGFYLEASQGSKIQQPKILTVPKGLKKASLGDQALWVAE